MKCIKTLSIAIILHTQIALSNPIKETATKTIKLTSDVISTYLTLEKKLDKDIEKWFNEISKSLNNEIDSEKQEAENFIAMGETFFNNIENFLLKSREISNIQNTVSLLEAKPTEKLGNPDEAYEIIKKSFQTLLTDPNDSKKFIEHINDMKIVVSQLTPDENEKHKEIIAIISFLDAHKDKNNLWNPIHLSFWANAWNNEKILSKIPLPATSQNLSHNEIVKIISKKL